MMVFRVGRASRIGKFRGYLARRQKGAAAVEFAVIAPLLFLLIFGMIEFGRVLMVAQISVAACREGARVAAVGDTNQTTTAVLASMRTYLSAAGITTSAVNTLSCFDTATSTNVNFSTIQPGATVRCTVVLNTKQLSWLGNSFNFLGRVFIPDTHTITMSTTMRKE